MTADELRGRALGFVRIQIKRFGRRPNLERSLNAYLRALGIVYSDVPAIDAAAVVEQALSEAPARRRRTHVALPENQQPLALEVVAHGRSAADGEPVAPMGSAGAPC